MEEEIGLELCVNKIKEDKRTSVQAKPRASLCTSSCDLHQGGDSLGAYAPAGVRARKLWELI